MTLFDIESEWFTKNFQLLFPLFYSLLSVPLFASVSNFDSENELLNWKKKHLNNIIIHIFFVHMAQQQQKKEKSKVRIGCSFENKKQMQSWDCIIECHNLNKFPKQRAMWKSAIFCFVQHTNIDKSIFS